MAVKVPIERAFLRGFHERYFDSIHAYRMDFSKWFRLHTGVELKEDKHGHSYVTLRDDEAAVAFKLRWS